MKIVRFGTITMDEQGKPYMTISERGTLLADVWKLANGKAANIRITITLEEAEKDSSEKGYYFGIVLPAIIEAQLESGEQWTIQ